MTKKAKKKKKEVPMVQITEEMRSDAFILKYEYAITETRRILEKIGRERGAGDAHKKIEYITSRIKSPESATEKLRRKGREVSVKSMEKHLNDLAGVCVVCAYYEDVYEVAERLEKAHDIVLLKKKDFIKNPKASGYRSLHLILGLPSHRNDDDRPVKVEVQIRTLTMDAWARLDHELHYKKKIEDVEKISMELRKCADSIEEVDVTMQRIRNQMKKI